MVVAPPEHNLDRVEYYQHNNALFHSDSIKIECSNNN